MFVADQDQLDIAISFAGQKHALAFVAQHLARLQVGYSQNLLAQKDTFIRVELADPAQDLPLAGLAEVQLKHQELT